MYSEEGFGVKLFKNNFSKVIDFIISKYDPETEAAEIAEIQRLALSNDVEALNELFDEPVSWLVADAINETEGITIMCGYRDNGHDGQYIGIDQRWPWTLSEKDKSLTRKECEEIFLKYSKLLGTSESPSFFTIHYD